MIDRVTRLREPNRELPPVEYHQWTRTNACNMHYLSGRQTNLLGALALALVDRLNEALVQGANRNLSSAAALVFIHGRPGETIDFLARVLGLSHSATVRVVDRLEADRFVERRSGTDRRSVALFLTAAGQAAAVETLNRRSQVLAHALSTLSSSERKQMTELVEKVLVGLTDDGWTAWHTCRLCDVPACNRPTYCPIDFGQPRSKASLART